MTRSAFTTTPAPVPAATDAGRPAAPTDVALRTATGPERQAFLLLRVLFTAAPIAFGVDKFVGVLADWDRYLAPWIDGLVPGDAHTAMLLVGATEIIAGLLVAVRPRIGGLVVAAWLAGIIGSLLLLPAYLDVALRDVGLLIAAVALSRAASAHRTPPAHARR